MNNRHAARRAHRLTALLIAILALCGSVAAAGLAAAQAPDETPTAAMTPRQIWEKRVELAYRLVAGGDFRNQYRAGVEFSIRTMPEGLKPRIRAMLMEPQVERDVLLKVTETTARLFNIAELEAAMAFYGTPIGRSIYRKTLLLHSMIVNEAQAITDSYVDQGLISVENLLKQMR